MTIDNRYVLVVLGAVGHGSMNSVRLAFSLFALHEGASPFAIGVIYSLFSLLPAAAAFNLGKLIDRVGALIPMMIAMVAFGAALAGVAAFPGLTAIYLAAPIVGTGFTTYNIGLSSITGQIGSPANRTANFGWLTVGFAIGSLLGPLAAGAMIDGFGYRETFAAIALVPICGALVIASRRRSLPAGGGDGVAKSSGLRDLLSAPGVASVIMATALFAAAWDVFIFVMPLLGKSLGMSATAIGVAMAWFSVGSFLARLALPALSRRYDDWTLMAMNFFVTAVGFALLPVAAAGAPLMVVVVLIGIGTGFGTPISFSLSYAVAPPGRQGELSGMRLMATALCHVTVPTSVGALGSALGLGPVLVVVAVGVAASGWYSLRQSRRFVR